MYMEYAPIPVSYTHLDVYKRQDKAFTKIIAKNAKIPQAKYVEVHSEDLKRIKKRLENPVLEKNFILSKHIKVSKNILSNNNILIIGSPGTGKSLFEVTPNLLLLSLIHI